MPWTMNVVSASIRMLMYAPRGREWWEWGLAWPAPERPCSSHPICLPRTRSRCRSLDLLHRAPCRLIQGDAAIGVVHSVLRQDFEALLLPRSRNAEDRDLLRWVVAQLQARLYDPSRHDVHPRVRHYRHHHRDLVYPWLLEYQLRQAARL